MSDSGFISQITVLGREKKILFGTPTVLCVITIIISLLLTPKYTAKTSLLPPQSPQGGASALLDQLGPLAGVAAGGLGLKSPADMYAAFLKSNTVRDLLIERFKLMERYKTKTTFGTYDALDKRVDIKVDKLSGLILLRVTDEDPQFAADLANGHIQALHDLAGRLSLSEAQQRRIFFEKQVQKVSEKPFQDVRVQELILMSLIRQYELARIDESREGPLFQQVDVASPPDERSSPKRTLMVIIAGILGLFIGTVASVLRHRLRNIDQLPAAAQQWKNLKDAWALPHLTR